MPYKEPKSDFTNDLTAIVTYCPDAKWPHELEVEVDEDGIRIDSDIHLPWEWILRAQKASEEKYGASIKELIRRSVDPVVACTAGKMSPQPSKPG